MGLLLQALSQTAVKVSVRAGVSSERLTGDGPTSKLTWLQAEFSSFRLRTSVPSVCWPEAALSSLPCGCLHWAACNMATCFIEAVESDGKMEVIILV